MTTSIRTFLIHAGALLFLFVFLFAHADAATLSVSPESGVYSAGGTFTARVIINTSGQSVNAAEGKLSFNPRELSVVSVSRSSSIFNLWTQEPGFSNSAGTITFGGGSPTGYSGSQGTVMTITMRTLAAGNPKINFTSGSVLAADGMGTNVLTSMKGGTYTVSAPSVEPEPEYIAPANTPAAPAVESESHPNPSGWYRDTTANLSWSIPGGITGVRTLLDESAGTIPTIVYDEPISSRTIEDLPQGVSYFHIQFRNAEGWGRVTHYRLGVDSEPPSAFTISEPKQDEASPEKKLAFTVEDISPVTRYLIQIDGAEPIEYMDEEETGLYTLPSLSPGHHTVIVEAFDSAGNSLISTYSFDVISFDKPVFTEYPNRINSEVIPVLRGTTRPRSSVAIEITGSGKESSSYAVVSDDSGAFTFIPESTFDLGVYDIVAVATDEYGAISAPSDPIRLIVEEPGYLRIGSFVISILSVIIPLLALIIISIFGMWYLWHRLRTWRKSIIKETKEAERSLAMEFDTITKHLSERIEELKTARKGKLTRAEEALIGALRKDVDSARKRIHKEISDIDDVVE